ncbi:MAG: ABC transporter substrate-binding protein, partial [Clostridia bacterium]|nr:ABC transporter substrate-binding protein [Clostridia bacterium]
MGCVPVNNEKTVLNVNEVTHSIFYSPFYLAIEKGYFEEEGIEIALTNGGGSNVSMTAVISGQAEIGLVGPETVVYVYNEGKQDYPLVFAKLTQRDGSFLISKEKIDKFDFSIFEGKEILAGRKGGLPAMTLEYVL